MNVFQLTALSIGSIFLGITIVFWLLVHFSNRRRLNQQESYTAEAVLATVISMIPLSISLTLFGLALV